MRRLPPPPHAPPPLRSLYLRTCALSLIAFFVVFYEQQFMRLKSLTFINVGERLDTSTHRSPPRGRNTAAVVTPFEAYTANDPFSHITVFEPDLHRSYTSSSSSLLSSSLCKLDEENVHAFLRTCSLCALVGGHQQQRHSTSKPTANNVTSDCTASSTQMCEPIHDFYSEKVAHNAHALLCSVADEPSCNARHGTWILFSYRSIVNNRTLLDTTRAHSTEIPTQAVYDALYAARHAERSVDDLCRERSDGDITQVYKYAANVSAYNNLDWLRALGLNAAQVEIMYEGNAAAGNIHRQTPLQSFAPRDASTMPSKCCFGSKLRSRNPGSTVLSDACPRSAHAARFVPRRARRYARSLDAVRALQRVNARALFLGDSTMEQLFFAQHCALHTEAQLDASLASANLFTSMRLVRVPREHRTDNGTRVVYNKERSIGVTALYEILAGKERTHVADGARSGLFLLAKAYEHEPIVTQRLLALDNVRVAVVNFGAHDHRHNALWAQQLALLRSLRDWWLLDARRVPLWQESFPGHLLLTMPRVTENNDSSFGGYHRDWRRFVDEASAAQYDAANAALEMRTVAEQQPHWLRVTAPFVSAYANASEVEAALSAAKGERTVSLTHAAKQKCTVDARTQQWIDANIDSYPSRYRLHSLLRAAAEVGVDAHFVNDYDDDELQRIAITAQRQVPPRMPLFIVETFPSLATAAYSHTHALSDILHPCYSPFLFEHILQQRNRVISALVV